MSGPATTRTKATHQFACRAVGGRADEDPLQDSPATSAARRGYAWTLGAKSPGWTCTTGDIRLVLLLFLFPFLLVQANTEIVNFHAPSSALNSQEWELAVEAELRRHGRALVSLYPSTSEWNLLPAQLGTPPEDVCASAEPSKKAQGSSVSRRVSDPACPHALWLRLALPEAHDAYTLRLSWRAYFPTDFYIDVLDPAAAAALLGCQEREQIRLRAHPRHRRGRAHARRVQLLPPHLIPLPPVSSPLSQFNRTESTLDPHSRGRRHSPLHAHLRAAPPRRPPASLLPFLLTAVPALLLIWWGVLPRVQQGVERMVGEARRELEPAEKKE
ncbi:hypothetical protein C8R43DRAFT_1244894 [Mycena crocata]|nr:hypothetical protein C8R43DRAFT_1244894 [Mycena crocata]